jgi:ferredoxin-type protein NapG
MTDEAPIKRRELLKLGARKAVRIASHLAAGKAAWTAAGWIRPPYARPELEFLLACTRCDKCIEACPYDVLFRLPAKLGRQVDGTPAMDLLNRGCHLCEDWPCVEACEPQALKRPDADSKPDGAPLVRLARARINVEICLPYLGPECGACAHSCPVPGALEWEGGLRPVINAEKCTGCALCREACILDPKAVEISAIVAGGENPAAD